MAAFVGVEVAECGNGTPPPGKVGEVDVGEGDRARTKVERRGRKDRDLGGEVPLE